MSSDVTDRKLLRANQKIAILDKLIEDSTRELYFAQEGLKSTNTYLNSIITSMVDMLVILDRTGTIKMINQATLNQLHYHEDEIKEKTIEMLVPQKWSDFCANLLKSGSKVQEMHWLCKRNEHIPVLVSGSVIKDDNGDVMSVVLLGKDMREYKKIQNQLMHSNKMATLGELFGYVSHEINTPLGTISMQCGTLTDLLNEDPLDKISALKIITSIHQVNERIASIVRELRSFVRESGNDPFQSKHIKAVALSTLAFCAERVGQGGIRIDLDIDDDDPNLILDCRPTQLAQVLLNLIYNSSDAIEGLKEKWIRITAASVQDRILLSVIDSGSGIPEMVREKIFDPFFTTKEANKGTGIGLNLCKKLIDEHNGTIRLEASSKNTCFVIELPKRQSSVMTS
ncbi:MAG: ATP-binding protein [Bdellovibrionota bacterium]